MKAPGSRQPNGGQGWPARGPPGGGGVLLSTVCQEGVPPDVLDVLGPEVGQPGPGLGGAGLGQQEDQAGEEREEGGHGAGLVLEWLLAGRPGDKGLYIVVDSGQFSWISFGGN